MPQTEITLSSGETLAVEASLEDVEKRLSDAARSGQSRLAWFPERNGNGRVAVNPAHVTVVRGDGAAAQPEA